MGSLTSGKRKFLALSRDFKETISDKMKAAILISILPPNLQDKLVQQADKVTDHKTSKEKITTVVEAKLTLKDRDMIDCDMVAGERKKELGHAAHDSNETD